MHWLFLVISVLSVLAAAAIADPKAVPEALIRVQSPLSKPKSKPNMSPTEIRQLRDTHFGQCMQDWDAGTHMIKKEWERTCRRIVDDRIKFMREPRSHK